MGVFLQKDVFGWLLAYNVLEAISLFCYENHESKRAKVIANMIVIRESWNLILVQ